MPSGVHASIRFDLLLIVLSILTDTGDSPCQGVYKLTITTAWHGGDLSHACPKCEWVISSMEGVAELAGNCFHGRYLLLSGWT